MVIACYVWCLGIVCTFFSVLDLRHCFNPGYCSPFWDAVTDSEPFSTKKPFVMDGLHFSTYQIFSKWVDVYTGINIETDAIWGPVDAMDMPSFTCRLFIIALRPMIWQGVHCGTLHHPKAPSKLPIVLQRCKYECAGQGLKMKRCFHQSACSGIVKAFRPLMSSPFQYIVRVASKSKWGGN